MPSCVTIGLAGNPNCGKTTIFNNLTGARQHVGNYPGVTVEKKAGFCRHRGVGVHIIDLPGTYSLAALSLDEVVARNFIVDEKPDLIVHVVDTSNLERNLYLTTQFMELGVPLVLALNMSDVAERRGMKIDRQRLSALFGAPIVFTVGHRNRGTRELLDAVVALAAEPRSRSAVQIRYGKEIEEELGKIQSLVEEHEAALADRYGARWVALKLLESDEEIGRQLSSDKVGSAVAGSVNHLQTVFGDLPEIVLADRRYGFISGACQEAVTSTVEARHTMSDKIDAVATNRVLGLPIFLALMYVVFNLTFTLGEAPMGWLESVFGALAGWLVALWPKGAESPLKSLLLEGVIGGVGGVLVFLPNIMLLFLAIAFLEDSGYMARAAFVMDKLMHRIGLHGKSFIPMLIGFGCSIPAIMATRILENRRDRLTTMLIVPLMSCGARLPIYALIVPAFFPTAWRGPMLWLIYLIGIVLAIISARLLRATIFRGESTPFVMELPPYRMPTLKGLLIHMWERSWLYLKKAGTIILLVSIVLWGLTSYPKKEVFDNDYDALARDAQGRLLTQAKALNPGLSLPADSELFTSALRAELQMRADQERYHRHESGFAEAEKRKNATVAALIASPNGAALEKVLCVREAVREARADFDAAVHREGLEKGSHEYVTYQSQRDAALAEIRGEHPKTYAAVRHYIDDVEAPLDQTIQGLANEKRAEELAHTVAGRIGHGIEPALKPLGFDWRIGTALIGAFAAKEVFVAQMGIVFAVGETDEQSDLLQERLRQEYDPLVAFCIMLFCLVSAPCVATIIMTRRESGSWKWAMFQLGGLTAMAYVLTLIVYQVGSLFPPV